MNIAELHLLHLKSSGICTDTRKVQKGNIFFALKGDNFNGNEFAEKAINLDCDYAIIDEKEYQINDRFILVEDVLTTLQKLANFHRKKLSCPVIGITGTNGKTTTKELIFSVLSTQHKTVATQGNLNNHIGVPLTLLRTPLDTEILIVEMGANHPKEIDFLCQIAQPNFGIITNIGKAHLEGFGSYDGVIATKNELYQFIKHENGILFVNETDELLHALSKKTDCIYYGKENAQFKSANPLVTLTFQNANIQSQLVGAYNYLNIIAACSIGNYFDVTTKNIKTAIENYTPSNNRSQVEKTAKGNTLILDAYNANPSSMQVAISSFKEMQGNQKTAILGDMLELGENSIAEHKSIIKLLEDANFYRTFLVGKEFAKTESSFPCFENTAKLSAWIEKHPIKGQTILLKGSRGIKLESLKEVL
ncbi:MAG: UDP-N-acetylmuramoyl-tripeptide--D-alanyl-D-alanine ligase [Bacteroidetes bacterium]|nr:UDP-N-acetylmuramoyl-tripeptide--D-alanyl-D-alanine ligase [Bacteroidota bacterium]